MHAQRTGPRHAIAALALVVIAVVVLGVGLALDAARASVGGGHTAARAQSAPASVPAAIKAHGPG